MGHVFSLHTYPHLPSGARSSNRHEYQIRCTKAARDIVGTGNDTYLINLDNCAEAVNPPFLASHDDHGFRA